MVPCDPIDPQETDPQSMLNKPKVLNFHNQELHERQTVTENIAPLYYAMIFGFYGASGVLSVLRTFQHSFKEE